VVDTSYARTVQGSDHTGALAASGKFGVRVPTREKIAAAIPSAAERAAAVS
jgi:hypothetical protein